MVIAIDGPAGSGKSTLAAALARRLGVERLDTGAMYRALGLAALRARVDPSDGPAVAALAGGLVLEVTGQSVWLEGVDVTSVIRAPEVTAASSAVAVHPVARAELVARQRAWVAARGSAVVEGRDIGTVVCPDADLKVYLTADPAERARRRLAEGAAGERYAAELGRSGEEEAELAEVSAELAEVSAGLAQRDRRDATRRASPLAIAPGAVVIDTTGRGVDDLVAEVMALLERAG